MPNIKGGKGYKRGKHSSAKEEKLIEWDETSGEMVGRVIKSMGSRRFRVYCNDNKFRLCRLAGTIHKSEWVSPGSVVLVGVRCFSTLYQGEKPDGETGDITHVFSSEFYKEIKELPSTNRAIFTLIEQKNPADLDKLVEKNQLDDIDDFFLQEGEDGIEAEDETEEDIQRRIKEKEKNDAQEVERLEGEKARDLGRKAKRIEKELTLDDL